MPTSRPPASMPRCGPTSCTARSPACSRTCSRTGTTAPSSRASIASRSSRTTGSVPSSSSTSVAGFGLSSTWRPDASSCMRIPAFQPANLALREAWFAGGVEWNIGIRGHTPLTCAPVFAARVDGPGGVPVLRMWEYERIREVIYQLDCWLPEGSPALVVAVRIVNPNDHAVPMYWWSNIAVPEADDVRVLAPGDAAWRFDETATVGGVELPVVDGRDVTYPAAAPGAADYFVHLDEGHRPWVAAVDGSGFGLVQSSTPELRGRKLFVWGGSTGGRHWQEWLSPLGGAVPRDPGRAAADPARARPDAGAGRVGVGRDLWRRAGRPGRRPRGRLVRCPRRDRAVAEPSVSDPGWPSVGRTRRGWPSGRRRSCCTPGRAGARSSSSIGAAARWIGRRHRSRWRASARSRRRGSTWLRPASCPLQTPPCHRPPTWWLQMGGPAGAIVGRRLAYLAASRCRPPPRRAGRGGGGGLAEVPGGYSERVGSEEPRRGGPGSRVGRRPPASGGCARSRAARPRGGASRGAARRRSVRGGSGRRRRRTAGGRRRPAGAVPRGARSRRHRADRARGVGVCQRHHALGAGGLALPRRPVVSLGNAQDRATTWGRGRRRPRRRGAEYRGAAVRLRLPDVRRSTHPRLRHRVVAPCRRPKENPMPFVADSHLQSEVVGQPDDWAAVVARLDEVAPALPPRWGSARGHRLRHLVLHGPVVCVAARVGRSGRDGRVRREREPAGARIRPGSRSDPVRDDHRGPRRPA